MNDTSDNKEEKLKFYTLGHFISYKLIPFSMPELTKKHKFVKETQKHTLNS